MTNVAVKDKEEKKASVSPVKEARHYPFPLLWRDMNQLFEDFSRGMEMWRPGFVEPFFGDVHVKVDFKDNEKDILVTAEVPGVDEKDIEITLSKDSLLIKGEKKEEKEEKQKGYYRAERSYGCFQRILPLPCEVDRDNVEAHYKNGVLKIILPKSQESLKNMKKVEIKPVSE